MYDLSGLFRLGITILAGVVLACAVGTARAFFMSWLKERRGRRRVDAERAKVDAELARFCGRASEKDRTVVQVVATAAGRALQGPFTEFGDAIKTSFAGGVSTRSIAEYVTGRACRFAEYDAHDQVCIDCAGSLYMCPKHKVFCPDSPYFFAGSRYNKISWRDEVDDGELMVTCRHCGSSTAARDGHGHTLEKCPQCNAPLWSTKDKSTWKLGKAIHGPR